MKINGTYLLRTVAGEFILVPTGKTALDFNGLVTFNEVGAEIWKCIENGLSIESIILEIINSFDVEPQIANQDVKEFINQLHSDGFLQ